MTDEERVKNVIDGRARLSAVDRRKEHVVDLLEHVDPARAAEALAAAVAELGTTPQIAEWIRADVQKRLDRRTMIGTSTSQEG